jgi:ribonuclease P protein subunit POP4
LSVSTITPHNLLNHELIGLDTEVKWDKNPINQSIKGRVVDETRNTLVIQSGNKKKTIIKMNAVFIFHLGNERIEVNGINLVKRPEDRVKKRHKRRW